MTTTMNEPHSAHDTQATWRRNASFLCGVLVDSVTELGSDLVHWSRHALPLPERASAEGHETRAA